MKKTESTLSFIYEKSWILLNTENEEVRCLNSINTERKIFHFSGSKMCASSLSQAFKKFLFVFLFISSLTSL